MAKHITITPGAPPAVPPMQRTSRRDILTAAGFTGLATVAVAGFVRPEASGTVSAESSPDAELLALTAEFNRLERQIDVLWAAPYDDFSWDVMEQPAAQALHAAQQPLFDKIVAIRASTPEGFKARAEMMALLCKEMLREEAEGPGNTWPDRMIHALVRDMVGAEA